VLPDVGVDPLEKTAGVGVRGLDEERDGRTALQGGVINLRVPP